jgi:hypothetical protein
VPVPEVAKEKEAEGTDAEVGETAYLVERVHGAERNTKDMRGQLGQEGAGRGMAIPRAS